jgi:hypothetical protein
MNDFPREYLGLAGTKFGCGLAQCLSCAGIADNPEGTSETSPTCVVPAASFSGKSIRTVEGHAVNGQLSTLKRHSSNIFRSSAATARLLLERRPCAAGAIGENAGGARGGGRDDPRRSRWAPLPLHWLYQIS